MAALVIALCNQKGGVGKTTTAFQLARAAIRLGQKVLLVDLDPQGNLTSVAAAEDFEDTQIGLADALSARTTEGLADVVVPGVWPGLDVAPTAGAALAEVRNELVIAGAGREARLREALPAVVDDYDLILIDCAPSLDQLTANGLTAADAVLIVTHSKLFSANGLAQLLATIDSVRAYYNPDLSIAGILVNQHDPRTVSGQHWLAELRTVADARSLRLLDPPIPKRVVISDATEALRGLDEWGSVEASDLSAIYTQHLRTIQEGANR